jgi:class 3 adenylate cyclase/tetratricopeptide (TPR) repeat protein
VIVLCPSCGTENADPSKFCRECGTRLSLSCTSCGSSLTPGSKFCAECGAAQSTTEPSEATTPIPGASSVAGTAERRVVSVLFVDLVGFTELSEGRDAEDVRELLDSYFDLARQTVERYGGTIEKFIGDAVMAVWGTPTAHEDDAERAVRAALDLVGGVAQLGASVELTGLAARGGVLTGDAAVTVGATGQGMVAGDLVNTASRLQSAAPPGGVLVGDATRRATEESVAYEPAGDQDVKGKALPVTAFRATRVTAKRRGEGRSDVLEPPFVGRDAELRLLKDLFHATGSERRPRLVSVLGQAGIGKSRLAWELLKYVDGVTELAYWHQGRSPAYGDGVAFWALAEMVRSRAGIAEGESDESARQKLSDTLDQFVPDGAERAWIAPSLAELIGLGGSTEPADAGGRERLFAGWRTFFERIAEQGTVVLVFEDLHWADTGLLDFIEHLLDWSRSSPIFVLSLARPELLERRSDWGLARRNAAAVTLEPLPMAAMRDLLDGMVTGLSEAAATAILARAEGIPLYAVETVRMLVQDGRIERSGEGLRPVGDLGEVAVPSTLQALIAARLDGLDPGDRQLLQAVSVLGQTFAVEAAAAVTGDDPGELEHRLRGLVRRELLTIDADPRSPERGQYGFVQGLMREVAYATLGRADRRRLHLAAAQHFDLADDDELSGIVATHYVAAYEAQPDGAAGEAVAAQARIALRAAAERAGRLGAWQRANGYLRQALIVTRDDADRADLLESAGAAARLSALYDASIEALQEAIALREQLGDRRRLLAAKALMGRALVSRGRMDAAREFLEAAAAEFADMQGAVEYVDLASPLTQVFMRLNEDQACVELSDRVLPLAEEHGVSISMLEILVNRGTALCHMDRPVEGAATLIGAIELAQLNEMPIVEARAIINISHATEVDEPRLAQEERGLELIERYGLRALMPFMLNNYAEFAMARGDWSQAIENVRRHADAALTDEERNRLLIMSIDIEALRGEVDAERLERQYAQWTVERDDPQVRAAIEVTRQRLALANGDLAEVIARGLASEELWATGIGTLADAGHAAARLIDAKALATIVTAMSRHRGRMVNMHVGILEAAQAALAGRSAEAVAGFRDGLRVLREVGLGYWIAITELTMVTVLNAPIADLRDLATGARDRFDAMGATTLSRQVDAAIASRERQLADEPRRPTEDASEAARAIGG